jgi:hypothetical protein
MQACRTIGDTSRKGNLRTLTNEAAKEVLVPFPGAAMRAWPISPRVKVISNAKSPPRFAFSDSRCPA